MVSVPTSLGEWIHSPWFDLGLVVWKGYRPRVRLVLAGGHASAWISPFWRGPAPGAQRYQAMQHLWSVLLKDAGNRGKKVDHHWVKSIISLIQEEANDRTFSIEPTKEQTLTQVPKVSANSTLADLTGNRS